jgi:hypothetical protein
MGRTTIDPETRARWAQEERDFHAYVKARLERLRESEDRRRGRLRRLSFGLLGR